MLIRSLLILFGSLLGSCASVLPPTQAMSDARLALEVAHQYKADDYAETNIAYAKRYLIRAEKSLSIGPHAYQEARYFALQSKDEAVFAREISENIRQVKQHIFDDTCLNPMVNLLWIEIKKQAGLGDALQVQYLSTELLKHFNNDD